LINNLENNINKIHAEINNENDRKEQNNENIGKK
jgi:hypothetical protein